MPTATSSLAAALAHPLEHGCGDCRDIQHAGPQLARPGHVALIAQADEQRDAATVAALEAERKPAAFRRRENRAASREAHQASAQRRDAARVLPRFHLAVLGQFTPIRRRAPRAKTGASPRDTSHEAPET